MFRMLRKQEAAAMTTTVAASEIQKNFGAYHDKALGGEAVCVTRYGRESVYIVSATTFHDLKQSQRRAIRVEDLTAAEIALIEAAEIPETARYSMENPAD
jgi:antitoxin StbD